jgi:arabinan endo-1,5-alpha-L-arabinosidase
VVCLISAGIAETAPLSLRGNLRIHDPSTVIKCAGKYYVFGTGPGITSKSSTDHIEWEAGPRIFSQPPDWTTNAVPGFRGYFWAPDVIFQNGQYYLYYSVSSWGSQISAIGLVTNPTLDPHAANYHWTDRGVVIQSGRGSRYNTIDPSVMKDSDGRLWMTFGSFWQGIFLVELDAKTGLRLAPDSPVWHLAYNDSIEASCLIHRGEYYYLFVNWGTCAMGIQSTYQIRMGRSKTIAGPYLDQQGVDMVNRGGSLFLRATGKYTGPGHMGYYSEDGADWFGYHYYDASQFGVSLRGGGKEYGVPMFDFRQLTWPADGWPAFTNDWTAMYFFQTDAMDENRLYDGQMLGGATVVNDPIKGYVLNLDGKDSRVSLPVGVANALTFTAEIRWEGGLANQRVFDFGRDTNRYFYLTPASSSGKLRFAISTNGPAHEQVLEVPTPLMTNRWVQLTVNLNGTLGALYVNGVGVASNNAMSVLPYQVMATNNNLGQSQFAADPHFRGQIHSFLASGKVLSQTEISDLTTRHNLPQKFEK